MKPGHALEGIRRCLSAWGVGKARSLGAAERRAQEDARIIAIAYVADIVREVLVLDSELQLHRFGDIFEKVDQLYNEEDGLVLLVRNRLHENLNELKNIDAFVLVLGKQPFNFPHFLRVQELGKELLIEFAHE